MISATIGPIRTRVRFPAEATETTAALTWFRRESSGTLVPTETSQGYTATLTGPLAVVRAPQREAVVERNTSEPVPFLDRLTRQNRRAREARDERVARQSHELRGRAELEHLAFAEHTDAMREGRGVLEVVGDENRGQSEGVEELPQLGANAGPRVGVERRERLVEEQHRGIAPEGAGERDALALAARELAHASAGEMADPEAIEERLRRQPPGARRSGRSRGRRGAGRARTPGTGSRPGGAPGRRRCGGSVSSNTSSPIATSPTARSEQTGDHAQNRRLACARGADERQRLAELDGQVGGRDEAAKGMSEPDPERHLVSELDGQEDERAER